MNDEDTRIEEHVFSGENKKEIARIASKIIDVFMKEKVSYIKALAAMEMVKIEIEENLGGRVVYSAYDKGKEKKEDGR